VLDVLDPPDVDDVLEPLESEEVVVVGLLVVELEIVVVSGLLYDEVEDPPDVLDELVSFDVDVDVVLEPLVDEVLLESESDEVVFVLLVVVVVGTLVDDELEVVDPLD